MNGQSTVYFVFKPPNWFLSVVLLFCCCCCVVVVVVVVVVAVFQLCLPFSFPSFLSPSPSHLHPLCYLCLSTLC